MLDPDTYCPFYKVFAEFKIEFEAEPPSRGPYPTQEDRIDEALAQIKAEILKEGRC